MILWCSYCQQFQREIAPFTNLDPTHGLCDTCAARGLDLDDKNFAALRVLADFQQKFWHAGTSGDLKLAAQLASKGDELHIRPIDMLLGFVGPALRQIGELWEQCKLSVAEEHRFTTTCVAFLNIVEKHAAFKKQVIKSPKIVLFNAEGNRHLLGLRFVELWLQSGGFVAERRECDTSNQKIIAAIRKIRPDVVGFSISLAEQLFSVKAVLDTLASQGSTPAKILLGGAAIKAGLVSTLRAYS